MKMVYNKLLSAALAFLIVATMMPLALKAANTVTDDLGIYTPDETFEWCYLPGCTKSLLDHNAYPDQKLKYYCIEGYDRPIRSLEELYRTIITSKDVNTGASLLNYWASFVNSFTSCDGVNQSIVHRRKSITAYPDRGHTFYSSYFDKGLSSLDANHNHSASANPDEEAYGFQRTGSLSEFAKAFKSQVSSEAHLTPLGSAITSRPTILRVGSLQVLDILQPLMLPL